MKANNSLFENTYFRIFVSIILSVVLWTYVSLNVSNEHTKVIKNVPVNFTYRTSAYQALGLSIIETDIQTVDVTISGPRSVTGDVTADDILIYPNITGIDGAGKYTFTLTAEKMSSVKNFSIASISTANVTVRLDSVISKEFPVEVDISTLIVAGDCMADMPSTNPSVVTVTGPEYKIRSIERVVAATVTQEVISRTTVLPAEIRLYDENDVIIDSALVTTNVDSVDITIPVMKEIIVPVVVGYVNAPDYFDTDTLHQARSISEIRLAVPAAQASGITEYVAGYIDLKTLETDSQYAFDVNLAQGVRSMDEVSNIYVTISGSNLTERVMTVSEIKVLNDTEGNIEVLTDSIQNVRIVGERDIVEALTDGSVIAQIDASKLATASGSQTVEVSFIIPSTNNAYVKGTYTVNIRV